ncbi:L,D-transpeptidase family protein [Erythrobacter sp. 3-20A1M]|uniref:L,D-transpeptidase family protein n=1 Tax=Erythrobacter sp. 3-20A1M TaxID=2653850 RepID=UPI001BFC50DB|nr:L,D-transpeptidase family protein [Erythrobacter sp. 3-20A1M]QWC57096.1 L,D-transpeptidase family protein [Erythrobacter sp. 3-20A1M]
MPRTLSLSLLLAGASFAFTAPGQAQSADPANLLPQERAPAAAPKTPAQADSQDPDYDRPTVDSAFAAYSDPVVQKVDPLIQHWSAAQARSLVSLIESIGKEGLEPSDYDLAGLRAAIDAGDGAALDDAASQRFVWLIEDMRDGRTPMAARKQWFVVDPDPDRYPTGTVMATALKSDDLAAALKSVAPVHPDYAVLKAELAKAKPGSDRARLVRANMDRWRWLARDLGSQYLITNVPEFQLRLKVGDKIVRTYKTVVGKPGRTATPQLAEQVEGVILNPTWTVPQSIVKGEGLGTKVLNNPGWARNAGYKATRGENGYISVVQQPGPGNSLGLMKLDMPNPHAIFLHDTPARQLFNQSDRALSHGCIRTERASELALTLAILQAGLTAEEGVEKLTSGEYTRVAFQKSMPVYITYFTMATNIDGKLAKFDDIYDRDAPVIASFDQPRVANRARKTSEEVVEIVDDLKT